MAGGGSRLACWGAEKVMVGVRHQYHGENPPPPLQCSQISETSGHHHAEPCLLQLLPQKGHEQAALGKGRPVVGTMRPLGLLRILVLWQWGVQVWPRK